MNRTMPMYWSPLRNQCLVEGKNIPLTREFVKALPEGFTVTGIFPNRRQRRAGIVPQTVNNRALTNERGVKSRKGFMQRFFDAVGNIIKTIFHRNY